MPMNLTQKILKAHRVDGRLEPGEEIAVRIDHALLQDATGTMVWLEFEAMGIERVQTEAAVQYIDHNLLQTDFKNVDDHKFLETAATRHGACCSLAGNGISHQVHMERFGAPGKTMLGADSHTPGAGGLGMLAIGAGGLSVALAMAGRPYSFPCPAVWGVKLTGSLNPWVSSKDVILEMLRRHTVKGAVGRVIEYYGPGVETLSVSDRAAIANMGAELGATSTVFPSDEQTRRYLASQGREEDFEPLAADADCGYDFHEEIALDKVEPLIAKPSMPDNIVPVAEVEGTPCHQVIVGSSANPGYEAIWHCVEVLRRRPVSPLVAFHINPGSRQVLANVAEQGGVATLIEAGATIHQSGCLGCIGMGQAPGTGQVSLRTFPRNFKGRSGVDDDQVYLCSPETAAASGVMGAITDPRKLASFMDYPNAQPLDRYTVVERIVRPPEDPASVEILRGPNIKPFPRFPAMDETIEEEVLLKAPDNITTDHILPAGAEILPLRSNIPAISEHVYKRHYPHFIERIQEKGSGIIIGGENYGQGSSREHAAIAPRYLGVKLKIVKSYARIHRANLINFGIVPLTFANPDDLGEIDEGAVLRFPDIRRRISDGDEDIPFECGERRYMARLEASPREREFLVAGGLINIMR
jgi:aconitate hydratase